MKYIIFIIYVISISVHIDGQKWSYSVVDDVFDGKIRTASIIGTSTNSSFNHPVFVFNKFEEKDIFNVYITDFGYYCDDPKIEIKFDNYPYTFKIFLVASNQKSAIFIDKVSVVTDDGIWLTSNKFELLETMMNKSTMYCRFSDNCSQERLNFSLSGSYNAIKSVMGDQYGDVMLRLNKIKEERIDEEKRLREENIAGAKRQKEERERQKELEEIKEWRKALSPGDSVLIRLFTDNDFIRIYEYQFSSYNNYKYKFTDPFTAIILQAPDYGKVKIQADTIIGYCALGYIYKID